MDWTVQPRITGRERRVIPHAALKLEESKILDESKGLEGWVLQHALEMIPRPAASIVCRAGGIKKSLSEERDQVKLR